MRFIIACTAEADKISLVYRRHLCPRGHVHVNVKEGIPTSRGNSIQHIKGRGLSNVNGGGGANPTSSWKKNRTSSWNKIQRQVGTKSSVKCPICPLYSLYEGRWVQPRPRPAGCALHLSRALRPWVSGVPPTRFCACQNACRFGVGDADTMLAFLLACARGYLLADFAGWVGGTGADSCRSCRGRRRRHVASLQRPPSNCVRRLSDRMFSL